MEITPYYQEIQVEAQPLLEALTEQYGAETGVEIYSMLNRIGRIYSTTGDATELFYREEQVRRAEIDEEREEPEEQEETEEQEEPEETEEREEQEEQEEPEEERENPEEQERNEEVIRRAGLEYEVERARLLASMEDDGWGTDWDTEVKPYPSETESQDEAQEIDSNSPFNADKHLAETLVRIAEYIVKLPRKLIEFTRTNILIPQNT